MNPGLENNNKLDLPFIVGLSGKKQSGKSTIANKLALYDNCVRVAFADALKEMCTNILGVPKSLVYGSEDQKNESTHIVGLPPGPRQYTNRNLTGRELLQVLGTDVMREFYPGVWIDALFRRLARFKETYTLGTYSHTVVVDDVRFINEVEAIQNNGGIVIRLTRESPGCKDLHISEGELDGYKHFDYSVDNQYMTPHEQYEEVKKIIKENLEDG